MSEKKDSELAKITAGKQSLIRKWMKMGLEMGIPKGQLKTFVKAKNKELHEEGQGRTFADWLADEAAEHAQKVLEEQGIELETDLNTEKVEELVAIEETKPAEPLIKTYSQDEIDSMIRENKNKMDVGNSEAAKILGLPSKVIY